MTLLHIDAGAPALAHGIGLFETMLVRDGRIQRVADHYCRLYASAVALGFPAPDVDRFRETTRIAFESVATLDEAAMRCLFIATGSDLDDPAAWTMVATAGPLPNVTIARRADGRVITLPGMTRSLPLHKMTSYAASTIGLRRATRAGASEGLFLDADGRVLEGTSTNVFAVAGDTLITAPVEAGILPGIVRAAVLDHAARRGITVEQRPPSLDELRAGSFMTSSLTTIAPIREVDGVTCEAPGLVMTALLSAISPSRHPEPP